MIKPVIVIGGGHAGCEAALASAKLQVSTLMITGDRDTIGLMPCNPAIGGPAKSQLVSEIDALGGAMGWVADKTAMQAKRLNQSRGPAVQCLRTQNDKYDYQKTMQQVIESANIQIITGMVMAIEPLSDHTCQVQLATGQVIHGSSVVVTTGTFLSACMHTGSQQTVGGRTGEPASTGLSDCFRQLGLALGRFKTGTPPRLHADSIDFSRLKPQTGDPYCRRFSLRTPFNTRYQSQAPCYLTQTTPESHEILRNNLSLSPMYTEAIKGTGPRYCPSIEDKVVRFSDKPSHHIFLEPESWHTPEIYVQGLNTSMPASVQDAVIKTMPGLATAKVLRYGYAVDYDYIIPTQLTASLATQQYPALFFAGQINGTSGYEEAAAQGIIAGINAARYTLRQPAVLLTREQSFIGTLIHDLVTKTIIEPYRLLTSRSEYRLVLRQDNAHDRLGELAHTLGLITESDYKTICERQRAVKTHQERWKKERLSPAMATRLHLPETISLYNACKRPEFDSDMVFGHLNHRAATLDDYETCSQAAILIKYDGYLKRQQLEIDRLIQWKKKPLPKTLDYSKVPGLRNEARLRFSEHRPATLADADHIGGINPADMTVLMTYLGG